MANHTQHSMSVIMGLAESVSDTGIPQHAADILKIVQAAQRIHDREQRELDRIAHKAQERERKAHERERKAHERAAAKYLAAVHGRLRKPDPDKTLAPHNQRRPIR